MGVAGLTPRPCAVLGAQRNDFRSTRIASEATDATLKGLELASTGGRRSAAKVVWAEAGAGNGIGHWSEQGLIYEPGLHAVVSDRVPDKPSDAVAATSLCKVFSDEAVISDVTFTVPEGAIVGFIGPSGSGKTTL